MNEHLSMNPQERVKKLQSTVASLNPKDKKDRDEMVQVMLHSMNDDTTLVRESAISFATRYIEPELLGEMVADDDNATLRNAALTALERQGPYALPHLKAMSLNSNFEVALFATQIMTRLKDPSSISALLPLLEHSDPNIVQAAVEGLGHIQAREAVPSLIHLLSADMWIQFAAVAALGDIGDERAVKPLLNLCDNDMLAELAMEALQKIASPTSVGPLFDQFIQNDRLPMRDHVIMALAAIVNRHGELPDFEKAFGEASFASKEGKNALAYLSSLLESEREISETDRRIEEKSHVDDRVSTRGGSLLVQSAVALVLAGKVEFLYPEVMRKTMDPDCLRWVVKSCRKFSSGLSSSLGELMTHEDGAVRRGVLLTVDPTNIPQDMLVKFLKDSSVHVRNAAYVAVGQAKMAAAVPILLDRFMTGRDEEMAAIADALGQMSAESLHPLGGLLEPSLEKEKIVWILRILENAKTSLFEEKLLPLVDSDDPLIRRLVLGVFSYSSREEIEWTIISKLDDPDDSVRTEAVELLVRRDCVKAFPAFLVILEQDDPLRYHVIRALGRFKKKEAVDPLQELYSRAAPLERIEVIMALVGIGDPKSVSFLKERVKETEQEVRRASVYGLARLVSEEDADSLLALAEDSDWYVRNEIAWGLGRLALGKTRETMLALVRDTEPVVARTAREALTKLGELS